MNDHPLRRRGVAVATLRRVLAALPDDDVVVGNEVGNLLVARDGVYIGWVDLRSDEHAAFHDVEDDEE